MRICILINCTPVSPGVGRIASGVGARENVVCVIVFVNSVSSAQREALKVAPVTDTGHSQYIFVIKSIRTWGNFESFTHSEDRRSAIGNARDPYVFIENRSWSTVLEGECKT